MTVVAIVGDKARAEVIYHIDPEKPSLTPISLLNHPAARERDKLALIPA
jgi:hypothetical protein